MIYYNNNKSALNTLMFVVMILRNIRLTSLVDSVSDDKTDCWPNVCKKKGQIPAVF